MWRTGPRDRRNQESETTQKILNYRIGTPSDTISRLGIIPLGRRCDLIVVTEILYWLSTTPNLFVVLQQSIKLFEAFVKSGFAVSRFPGFQIRHSDEIFLADQYHWNVVFLNDSAEMA
jgi:hypothetical protein